MFQEYWTPRFSSRDKSKQQWRCKGIEQFCWQLLKPGVFIVVCGGESTCSRATFASDLSPLNRLQLTDIILTNRSESVSTTIDVSWGWECPMARASPFSSSSSLLCRISDKLCHCSYTEYYSLLAIRSFEDKINLSIQLHKCRASSVNSIWVVSSEMLVSLLLHFI